MELDRLTEQIKERARLAVEEHKLDKEEEQERKRQIEAQAKRDDYPELLRTQILSGLAVENTGDYADDLAAFQENMRQMVLSIPDDLIRGCRTEKFCLFIKNTVNMLNTKPEIPVHKLEEKEPDLEPYIKSVLVKNLKARTFGQLFSKKELVERTFSTCVAVTIDARLMSLAAIINEHLGEKDLQDPARFVDLCAEAWDKLLDDIAIINDSGYFQCEGSYIVPYGRTEHRHGWDDMSYADCPDRQFFLIAQNQWVNSKEKKPVYPEVIARFKKIKQLAEAIENLPSKTKVHLLKEMSFRKDCSILGQTSREFESFGIWSTNQCLCSMGRHMLRPHKECSEAMLKAIDLYSQFNVIAAAIIFYIVEEWNGTSYGYNCPDESLVENSKEPLSQLQLLVEPEVVKVFKRLRSPARTKELVIKLIIVHKKYRHYCQSDALNFRWIDSAPNQEIILEWLSHLNDKEYWKKKSA